MGHRTTSPVGSTALLRPVGSLADRPNRGRSLSETLRIPVPVPVDSQQLRITVEDPAGGQTVVRLDGELDIATQSAFRDLTATLLPEGHVRLVVDLAGLTFLDSTGIGALIGLHRRVHELGGSLVLVGARDRINNLFTIVALDQVFDIRADRAAAGV